MVRSVFDVVIEDYPEMQDYLHSHANIVDNPDFESGLVKIIAKDFLNLTDTERQATSTLMMCTETEVKKQSSTGGGYFEECKSRKRRRLSEEEEQYMDCSFLVATSNTVERLFSACKYVLTDKESPCLPSCLKH